MNNEPAKRWIMIAGAAVAAVLVIILLLLVLRQPALPESIAFGNGRLEAIEYDIATKHAGKLEHVLVDEGDMVTAGQTLAIMEITELESLLHEAEANLDRAKESKKQAKALVSQRNSERNLASKDFSRSQKLFQADVISKQDMDSQTTRLQSATAALQAAQAMVAESDAAMAAARANIERVQTTIDDSFLKTPVNGRVLYKLAEPGEVLGAGSKALTVLDLNDTYMTIFLPTAQAGKTAIGSEARIVLDALPEQPLPATVSFVSPEAQFTPKEVETKTEREKLMFRIKVRLDTASSQYKDIPLKAGLPGMAYVKLDNDEQWPESLQIQVNK